MNKSTRETDDFWVGAATRLCSVDGRWPRVPNGAPSQRLFLLDSLFLLVKAAELLELSYRQARRVYRRYRQEGERGLVHRLRGGDQTGPAGRSACAGTAALRGAVQRLWPDAGGGALGR